MLNWVTGSSVTCSVTVFSEMGVAACFIVVMFTAQHNESPCYISM